MSGYYYDIAERNVDGCGTDAHVFVKSFVPLDIDLREKLAAHLAAVKRESIENHDDLDTEEMVQEALTRFGNETNVAVSVYPSPIHETIEF